MIIQRRKQVDLVINFMVILICIVHISLTGYHVLFPDLPSMRIQDKTLKDIEFPFFIQMCVSEIDNSTERYTNLGYKNGYDFYLGRSVYNKSLFGWNGHLENGSTVGTVEGKFIMNESLYLLNLLFRYSYKCIFSIKQCSSLN